MKTDDTDDENETEDDGQTSESGSGSPPDQKLQHKMCVFRFKLMQFINCIHNHFMTRVSGTLSVIITVRCISSSKHPGAHSKFQLEGEALIGRREFNQGVLINKILTFTNSVVVEA